MNEQQKQLLDRMFEGAYVLPETERQVWLDQHCDDPEVRAEVEELLHFSSDRGEFNKGLNAAAEIGRRIAPSDLKSIGPYRIVRILGQGGMGTVYEAVREDSDFHQTVAIKVLRMSAGSHSERRRFLQERQILARLDHPNIARLFDGGMSTDSSPYIVMERIAGECLMPYVKSRKLTLRPRLRLFLEVADAVQYAHQNLIVHRDLKPGNILVTADGGPKLLDFGIAKLLDAESAGPEGATATGARLMTPDYASPEQVRGEPVTVASDIYSLGAILYELLTELRPHGLKTYDPAEITERICIRDITQPSAYGGRALRGDLDTIVLKAMHKEAARRYSSVDHFAADVRNYLEGWPIAARRDSLGYRAAKFVRRRRLPLVAAAMILASLILGLILALIQTRRAEAAGAIAQIERARAQQRLVEVVDLSNQSLSEVYRLLETLSGTMGLRQQVVQNTLDLLERLAREAGEDDRLRLALGTAYLRMGDLQGNSFTGPGAFENMGAAMVSYRAGLALLKPLLERKSPDPETLLLWVQLQQKAGYVLSETGDSEKAIAALLEAARAGADLTRLSPDNKLALRSAAEPFIVLSRTLQPLNSSDALKYGEIFLSSVQSTLRHFPSDPDVQMDLSRAHTHMGFALLTHGEPEKALTHMEESLSIREKLAREYPHDEEYRRNLMLSYEHVGTTLGSPFYDTLGRPVEAHQYYERARQMEEARASDVRNLQARHDLAFFLLKSEVVDVPQGQVVRSLGTLRRSAAMLESLRAQDPAGLRYNWEIGSAHEYIGQRLAALGRNNEARNEYEKVLSEARPILKARPLDVAGLGLFTQAQTGIAEISLLEGDRRDALEHVQSAIARVETSLHDSPDKPSVEPLVAEAYLALGSIKRDAGAWREARESAATSLRHLRSVPPGRTGNRTARISQRAESLLGACALRLGYSSPGQF